MARGSSGLGFEAFIAFAIVGIVGLICISQVSCGVGGFGPQGTTTAKVLSKHVDASKESSHYMVTTDAGTFEVGNGVLLGVWNADEIYGSLAVGETYTFTTKGKKWVNMWMQEYPYVTDATKVAGSR